MTKEKILKTRGHRPFPLPNLPWVMQQSWKDLLFLHYKVPYTVLRKLVPQELEIDTYNGDAWISISPFKMRDVRFRLLPPVPTAYNFLELNVRTYVKLNGRGGIYFFSLDTSSTLSALGARTAFLPYFRAEISVKNKSEFHFKSRRIGFSKTPAELEVLYKPLSEPFISEKDSLEDWLVERYCLFQEMIKGKFLEIDIHHLPWTLQHAEAKVFKNTLTEPFGFTVPDQRPLIHFSKFLKVLVWPGRIVSPKTTGL